MTASLKTSDVITRGELIVAITICLVLAGVGLPFVAEYMLKDRLVQSLSGSRQLYIACFSMAVDYGTTKDERLGWAGDLSERKLDPLTSATTYLERIMEYEYLKKIDMVMMLQHAGGESWKLQEPLDAARHCPFKIYRVKESDGAGVLFCATRNFTYNAPLAAGVRPHGDRGFTVFRKGGDGAVFNNKKIAQPADLTTLGLLPGRTDYATRNVETSDDSLLPR